MNDFDYRLLIPVVITAIISFVATKTYYFLVDRLKRNTEGRFYLDTDIHNCCRENKIDSVRTYLEEGGDPNSIDLYGQTPLFYAIQRENNEIVEMLLSAGAVVNVKDKNNDTPVRFAAKNRNLALTQRLLDLGADLEIYSALVTGNYRYIQTFVESNQDANIFLDGGTLLSTATDYGGREEIINLLLNNGADPNAVGLSKWTPLHKAAINGRVHVARLLIDSGAKCNATLKSGATPLHLAVGSGQYELVELLLDSGADVNCKFTGGTSLHVAVRKKDEEILELLLSHNADPNVTDFLGKTPLHDAARQENVIYAEKLLSHGADVNAEYTIFAIKPLYFAKSDEMISLLKQYGASEKLSKWADILQKVGLVSIR